MNIFTQIIRFISGWWISISILSGFALLQILTFGSVLSVPFGSLVMDVLMYSGLYVLIAVLLWNTLKYANFNTLTKLQQFIIYAALVLLALAIISGIALAVYHYIPFEGVAGLETFIPVRILISLLVVFVLLQHFSLKVCEINNSEIPVNEQKEIIEIGNTVVESKNEIIERIAVKSGSKIHVVQVSEIVYVQSDGDYVHIFTLTGKYLKEQTMKYFEESLPPAQFVRVHRSYIVNVQAIARVELYDKQNQQLTLKNGHQIKASQAGYKLLRSRLNL